MSGALRLLFRLPGILLGLALMVVLLPVVFLAAFATLIVLELKGTQDA